MKKELQDELRAGLVFSKAHDLFINYPFGDQHYEVAEIKYLQASFELIQAMTRNGRFGSAGLPLGDLRKANTERQALWCPDPAEQPDLSFRGNELAGETGEACNVIKKLERERHGWRGERDTIEHLAEELADVIICVDLIAGRAGIDLSNAVRDKFNATSRKVGLPTMLGE